MHLFSETVEVFVTGFEITKDSSSYFPFIVDRTANLHDLSKGIKMIASLLDDTDDSNRLLDAARGLASAFSTLLQAAQDGSSGDKDVCLYYTSLNNHDLYLHHTRVSQFKNLHLFSILILVYT